jgi:hypothetical protein
MDDMTEIRTTPHAAANSVRPRRTGATSTSPRRPAATGAALSVGVAAAALAAFAAPTLSVDHGLSWTSPSEEAVVALEPIQLAPADRAATAERSARSSRSGARGEVPSAPVAGDEATDPAAAAAEAEPEVVGTRYTTVPLNVRTEPSEDAEVLAVLEPGAKVKVTAEKDDEWRQVVHKGEVRWVKGEYLSKTKPDPKPAGPSSAPCASGSGVESGLTSNTIAVHRAVCNAFPSVSSYGGVRGGSANHGSGRALDIMVSGSAGDAIASYVRANAAELGVTEVIWEQKIWTTQRAGEGWRWMSDRGSATANHYDHVHVTTR